MSENAKCPACGNTMRWVTEECSTYWRCDNCMGKSEKEIPKCPKCGMSDQVQQSHPFNAMRADCHCNKCGFWFNAPAQPEVKDTKMSEEIMPACPECHRTASVTRSVDSGKYWCHHCSNSFDVPALAQPDAEAVGLADAEIGKMLRESAPEGWEINPYQPFKWIERHPAVFVYFRKCVKPTPGQIADELLASFNTGNGSAEAYEDRLHKAIDAAVKALREMGK